MSVDGRADCTHDRRYHALVLLATFASLRWGEATALALRSRPGRGAPSGCAPRTSSARPGKCSSARPSPKAGRRVVGIPDVIIPALREHLSVFVKDEPGALVFPGARGGPLRRGNFNKMSAWPHAVAVHRHAGLHFHDLRHTGNHFAAPSGAGLHDLMARMGHDSERAAMIYQHEARGADQPITSAIDAHVHAERARTRDDGPAGVLVPAG